MSDVHRLEFPTPASRSVDETRTMDVSAPRSMPETENTAVGAMLSRYVVLQEAGRGGMGRVLRAYDPKLQREVALKEVCGGLLDAEAASRLVAEARAMAKLSHANVVAVYDVEELDSGEIVLVMEYVPGQTLKQWLRQQERPWHAIVDHFMAAGRGLIAAHEAGLLHRDFKPANVLVSTAASGVHVKVTDFGLAKPSGSLSMASSVSDASPDDLTKVQAIAGTPRYMAPEQHESDRDGSGPGSPGMNNSSPLTVAADQYAFCVALWEALCGEPPFSGRTMAADKTSGPPPWRNASIPGPIAEAIVRGLSPQPDARWPSMEALLDALSYDPARRRNRWLLGVGTAGVLGLAGVSYDRWAAAPEKRCTGAEQQLVGIWDSARGAEVKAAILRIGKSYAEGVWDRTKRELDAYALDWASMHTEACEATTVRGEQSPEMPDLRMQCLHRAAVELQAAVETLAEADDEVVLNAHKLTKDLRPLSRCADTEALSQDVEPPLAAETEAVEAVRSELARAKSLHQTGRYEAARAAVERAKVGAAGLEYRPVHTEVALREGFVLDALGEYELSEAALLKALEQGSRSKQWEAMGWAASELMYVIGYRQRRVEEGLQYRVLAGGLSEGDPRKETSWRSSLASVLHAQGKYTEAEAEYRAALSLRESALGPEHPDVAKSRNNLANILFAQGKYAEAEAQHRAALSLRESALGPEHPDVAMSQNNIAIALFAQGKYAEAEAQHRAALSLKERSLGPEHPDVASSRNNLASVLNAQGKYAEAEAELREALSLRQRALGPEHPEVANARNNLAIVLSTQGKSAEAEAEFRAALSLKEKVLGPEHPDVASSRNNLAIMLSAQGKSAEAEAEFRTALSLWEKALDPEHPDVASARSNLAEVLLAQDRAREALPLAEQAWDRRQRDDVPLEQRAQTAFVLARLLWRVGTPKRDRTRARALAEDAVRSYRDAGESHADNARQVQQWLDEHPLRRP